MKLLDFKWLLPALGDFFTFYGGSKSPGPQVSTVTLLIFVTIVDCVL